MKLSSSFETRMLGAFAVAVLVIAALTASTWKVAQDASEAATWVAHTHEVLDKLAQVRRDTLQIEFSTQSFRISGDPARITERDASIAARENSLRLLRQLTVDNAQQQEHLTQLRAVIDERLAISRHVEMLRKAQDLKAANAYVASSPLQETRERTYRLLDEMNEIERKLLDGRQAEQLRARQSMVLTGTLVSLLLVTLLVATYGLIRRQLRATESSRQALAESEENLSITLHSIGDGVLATDKRGRITRLNPVAEKLTGWSFAQAQGRPVEEVFHIVNERTRALAEVPVTKVLATGEIQELANHTALIARDGSECPIADSAAPIRDATGQVNGVVLVFRDCSAEYLAQKKIREQNELLDQRVNERTAQLKESEDHLRSVTNNVPALIAYVDSQQRFVYSNHQYRECYAQRQTDITGCTVREILGEARYAIVAPLIAKVLSGQPQSLDWQPFPGSWQTLNYVPKRDADNRIIGYYILNSDITERKHAEEKIQKLNSDLEQRVRELERASRALRTLSAGNRTMLHATDEQNLLDTMCSSIVHAGGYGAAAVWYRNDDTLKTLHPMSESGFPGGLGTAKAMKNSWADSGYGRGAVGTAIRTGETVAVQNMRTNPNYAPWRQELSAFGSVVACPLRIKSEVIGCIAVFAREPDAFDPEVVTLLTESADDLAYGIATLRAHAEQQKIQQNLYHLSRHDALTGLPNEAYFSELLTNALNVSKRRGQSLAVLQINIERLSEINVALGFSHGDQLLREFGARLSACVVSTATVARLRGDEFAILLPDGHANDATAMMHRLEAMWTQPFPIADISLDVSAKIGVALFPKHGATAHDLLRHMDIAVKQAKRTGAGYAVFDPAQNKDQSKRLTLAGELRRAIEGGDLLLYLQPKVEMVTGRVCGAEGLVRWQHAQRGLIPPGEFIDLAEHTGLIKPLSEWVIETALRLNQAWEREDCALPIAVNLSARNLRDEHLLEKILRMQATWGVTAGLLELEITESTVMDDAEMALRVLHSLRTTGIPLCIDDFGTGYSSLGYLQKLPVEYIKIDQSFVHDMPTSKDSSVIVRSTIDLIHDLGHVVVAEGVETKEHWDQLLAFGCDIAQGYYIARPMPSAEFQNWRKNFRLHDGAT